VITDPIDAIGTAANTFFSSEAVQTALLALALYLFVIYLASAWWVFRDLRDRTEIPMLPYLAAGLVLLASPLFFVGALIVYRIIRPPQRLDDIYERNLATEALLAEAEQIRTCPGCDRRVDQDWIICPWCRARLQRVCLNCDGLIGLDWTLCARCGRNFERASEPVPMLASDPAPTQTVAAPSPRISPVSPRIRPVSARTVRAPAAYETWWNEPEGAPAPEPEKS
jgi:RNA polymerase subunit RPABC4/transcription elongation factor Spt4